ncbi:MAG: pyrroline-5-carboxylate reductase [Gammaproteobacteria bacterium]|nr:pyrroline-5-carboxylate reductase [Gammaproteobacteria bacterium]
MTSPTRIAFIGGGNMARSLIGGLLKSNWAAAGLSVSEPAAEAREALQRRFGRLGVTCVDDNAGCAAAAEVVVLAVKPQVLRAAVQSAAAALQRNKPLLISIAAGIRCADVLRWAGGEMALVRAMPNTPALVNAGVSGLFANPLAGARERDLAEAILRAVGETLWVGEEALLDTVTGISGSGPAYLFKWMELLAAGAEAHGLDRDAANALVVQTALGAALLAKHGGQAPDELRRQVTSRGGTTEAALEQMEALGLDDAVRRGIDAAIRRSVQIADQFGAA